MRLTYIYHSGFALECEGFSVLMDFYQDTPDRYVEKELLKRPGRLYVLSSHFHADHFNPEVLTWKELKKDIVYVFSKDILRRKRAVADVAVYLKKGEFFVDEHIRVEAFGSTDVGVSFYLEVEGKRVFHAGDLNNWHWSDESTPEEIRQAEGAYRAELSALQKEHPVLDLVMFPVDPRLGSDFARGARQLLEQIRVERFVPMHFWERPSEILFFETVAEQNGAQYEQLSQPGEAFSL